MFAKRLVIVAVIVVVLSGLTVWAANAQGPSDNWPGGGRGGWMGHGGMGRGGMMGQGMGMMGGHGFGFGGAANFEVIATALNLESAVLTEELQSGKTLSEIAAAQGVDVQVVIDAIMASRQEQIDLLIEQGQITQEQADLWITEMAEDLPEHLNLMFSGNHFGFGQGGVMMGVCPFFETAEE